MANASSTNVRRTVAVFGAAVLIFLLNDGRAVSINWGTGPLRIIISVASGLFIAAMIGLMIRDNFFNSSKNSNKS